jgi:type VI secretion system secreted protein Hcp
MALVDYFLKIEGIEGESIDSKHSKEIEVQSWSWGESNAGSHGAGGGGGAGKVAMQDFHFTVNASKASPNLFLACAEGRHIKTAKLTCRKAGKDQQEYLVIDFSDLLISSFQTGGSASGNVLPLDQVSFNFTKIEMKYRPQKADGTLDAVIPAGWNVKENKKA